MAKKIRDQVSLYEEAKAGLFSSIQQTWVIFVGFMLMLIFTGGAPSSFILSLSVFLGIAFVSWGEQKRVRNLQTSISRKTMLGDSKKGKARLYNTFILEPILTPSSIGIYFSESSESIRQNALYRNSWSCLHTLDEYNDEYRKLDWSFFVLSNSEESESIVYAFVVHEFVVHELIVYEDEENKNAGLDNKIANVLPVMILLTSTKEIECVFKQGDFLLYFGATYNKNIQTVIFINPPNPIISFLSDFVFFEYGEKKITIKRVSNFWQRSTL